MKHAWFMIYTLARSGARLGALAVAAACGMPATPHDRESNDPTFELIAHDARGRPAPLERLPRRPQFVVSSTRALEAGAELLLFHGLPDSELLDDLTGLPLRAAHDVRRIAGLAAASSDSTTLRFVPSTTLSAASAYTLAMPGGTRVRGGAALAQDGPGFLAELRTAGDPAAGATWVSTLPPDGASGAPPNLARVYVALDGVATGAERGLWLEAADGLALASGVEAIACDEVEARGATCLALTPAEPLGPSARVRVRSGHALQDAHGAAVAPLDATFETAPAPDLDPPAFAALACLRDEAPVAVGCALLGEERVRLRVRTSEPLRLVLRSGERRAARLAPAGSAELELAGFEPDEAFELELEAIDLAGNRTDARLSLRTPAGVPTLSITEVRADPGGPEPAQEYVEIENYGAVAVELEGLELVDANDGRPSVVGREPALPAGARGLLVADGFDPANELDPLPPPGTRLIQVGATLTRSGLANSGERLLLRDRSGNRLSAFPPRAATAPRRCLRRIEQADPRTDAAEAFEEGACTPGR